MPAAPAKRPRGRPKGTTKFELSDLTILARFADQLVAAPGAKLAPFLRESGYAEIKDIRRVQQRWRQHKARLLKEATLRADAQPADTLASLVMYFAEAASDVTDAAKPAIQAIYESRERAKRRIRARKELGLDPDLPLDLRNGEKVAAAVRHYEARMFRSLEEKANELPPVSQDKLPIHLKLYSAAILLHELSLQMADEPTSSEFKTSINPIPDQGDSS